MSEILAALKRRGQPSYWLILDCGHWYKWGNAKAPKANADFPCPECKGLPTVVPIEEGRTR